MAKSQSTSLWRPGNALSALSILFLKACAKLPMPCLLFMGKCLGTLAAWIFPYRKRIALINLRLCYPDMSEKDRRKLIFKHYQAMGMGVFELAAAWYKPDEAIRKISKITGLEHIEAVKQSGRGALLMTAHFTTLEMVGRILLGELSYGCLYRNPDQPILAKEMTRIRQVGMSHVIHMDEIKELIRVLRAGQMIWYTPDQARRIKYSEVLPFFGVPAVTNTATGRIVKMGKAAVIPFTGYRLPDGTYQVDILPPFEDFPTDDPSADAMRMNDVFKVIINRSPDQYFWLHKRFKRRGEGFPDVYAKDSPSN